ncbi:MAG TPA: TadE family protein [Actinomycetes bacterium]|jgi:Flp pilus assembly protein TadG|nr:TadE family protein [Actinomycetes bacterium]
MGSRKGLCGALTARARRAGPERGSATETAIVYPVTLLAIMAIIQFGLAYHAQHVALAVAQEGARSARLYRATNADGLARANRTLQALNGGSVLRHPHVDVTRSAGNDWVRVTVSGDVVPVVPGLTLRIRPQVAQGPVERFRGATGG